MYIYISFNLAEDTSYMTTEIISKSLNIDKANFFLAYTFTNYTQKKPNMQA